MKEATSEENISRNIMMQISSVISLLKTSVEETTFYK